MAKEDKKTLSDQHKQPYWLIYIALLIAGMLLLTDAYHIAHLNKWTARLGIALIYTAFAFLIGSGRWVVIPAVTIVWLGVLVTGIW